MRVLACTRHPLAVGPCSSLRSCLPTLLLGAWCAQSVYFPTLNSHAVRCSKKSKGDAAPGGASTASTPGCGDASSLPAGAVAASRQSASPGQDSILSTTLATESGDTPTSQVCFPPKAALISSSSPLQGTDGLQSAGQEEEGSCAAPRAGRGERWRL